MFKPAKMKQVVITLLSQDVDKVIKYLGREGLMQFSVEASQNSKNAETKSEVKERAPYLDAIEKIEKAADFINLALPENPFKNTEPPGSADLHLCAAMTDETGAMEKRAYDAGLKRERLQNSIDALSGFSGVKTPLSGLKDLSFLNLRVGKIEPEKREALSQSLKDRAIVIPVGENEEEILAISSKKGRFALDSELSRREFVPNAIPEGIEGSPDESIKELRENLNETERELQKIELEKRDFARKHGDSLRALYASCIMARSMDEVKSCFAATAQLFQIKGWVEAGELKPLALKLSELTEKRASVRAFDPHEVASVKSGDEKIPIVLKHGRFARTFQPLVLSYGVPLYGAIDPTPLTAFFFSLLFAIMFGDVGQGAVLLLFGIIFSSKWGAAKFSGMKSYAGPLKVIGPLSMFTGLLYGSVFANETLLEKPTEAFTGWLAATSLGRGLGIHETGHLLHLMPEKDSLGKLFMFFGFTVAIGIIINSIGIFIFIMNNIAMRRYEKALFSRNGTAGLCFFWYAVSIGIRAVIQQSAFSFGTIDFLGLLIPVFFIVFGPVIYKLFTAERPLFHEGVFAFFMEGIVDILETISSYISNTVSFLRVGAFALSHAVLSFIIFTNAVIILLESMIVAIQVVRLQYYEFFSKFFTETGVEFSPFKFERK